MPEKHPNNLKTYRKRHEIKQNDMRYLCDKTKSISLTRYEQGTYLPDIKTLVTYAIVFDVTLKDLIPKYYAELSKQILDKVHVLLEEFGVGHCTFSNHKRKDFWEGLLDRISCLQQVHEPPTTTQEENRSSDLPLE